MGTKPTHTYIPNEFHSISLMEKRLRGELSTIIRMKQRREQKLKNLKRFTDDLRTELKQLDIRLKEFSHKIKGGGDFEFPKFGIHYQQGKTENEDRYRIHYTIQRRREKIELGNSKSIEEHMEKVYSDFSKLQLSERDDLILREYQNEIQMKYWEREYKRWVEGCSPTTKK